MFIAKNQGKIFAFSKTKAELDLNMKSKGQVAEQIEETNEKIVPYYNTPIDGIYFKASELPTIPKEEIIRQIDEKRRECYAIESDPITNQISVLREQIIQKDFLPGETEEGLLKKINVLHNIRKSIRAKIQHLTSQN